MSRVRYRLVSRPAREQLSEVIGADYWQPRRAATRTLAWSSSECFTLAVVFRQTFLSLNTSLYATQRRVKLLSIDAMGGAVVSGIDGDTTARHVRLGHAGTESEGGTSNVKLTATHFPPQARRLKSQTRRDICNMFPNLYEGRTSASP